jgi:ABC-type multidrug transport system fused ATPase/permease subunit
MDCKEAEDFAEDQSIEVGRVIIDNGTFSWDSQSIRDYFSEKKPAKATPTTALPPNPTEREDILEIPVILKNINVDFQPKKFTVIIGKVGSGKSSLLNACINEMVCNSGQVRARGKIAYIPREAFLLNDSIRENI